MIEEEWRYFAPGGLIDFGGPSTWFILDWDQRRLVAVAMDEQDQESCDKAVEQLKKYIDTLPPDVVAIRVADDDAGTLLSTSSDANDDQTTFVHYAPPADLQMPKGVSTVRRSELRELDRLGLNVGLIESTLDSANGDQKRLLVFKYYFMTQFAFRIWLDLNICMRLPPHPNIMPFDRVVVDEVHGGVVGFTTAFVPGGTLDDEFQRTPTTTPPARVIRLAWIQQLLATVDDLTFRFGIAHQDIAPRNLLVDPATHALRLFDFSWAGRIGDPDLHDGGAERSDVKGALFSVYELITRDTHFRERPCPEQDTDDILPPRMPSWRPHLDVRLDHDVDEFRKLLDTWLEARRQRPEVTHYSQASEPLEFRPYKPP